MANLLTLAAHGSLSCVLVLVPLVVGILVEEKLQKDDREVGWRLSRSC